MNKLILLAFVLSLTLLVNSNPHLPKLNINSILLDNVKESTVIKRQATPKKTYPKLNIDSMQNFSIVEDSID